MFNIMCQGAFGHMIIFLIRDLCLFVYNILAILLFVGILGFCIQLFAQSV